MTMFTAFKRFIRDDEGATAIEYGLIAALVSVAAITALSAMGDSLDGLFTEVSGQIDSVVAAGGEGGEGGE